MRLLTISDVHQKATVKATFRISVQDNEPMHGHIAVTGRPGEMRVMWGSAKSDNPRVKVGCLDWEILNNWRFHMF